MKGKLKKNVIYFIILGLFVVLFFRKELPIKGLTASTIKKDAESQIGYKEEIETVVIDPEATKAKKEVETSTKDLQEEAKTSQITNVVITEETLEENHTSMEEETTKKVYNKNLSNIDQAFENEYNDYVAYESPEGWTYRGEWDHDVIQGSGNMLYSNGDSYTGEFVKGEKSGKGTYCYADGSIYEGDWNHDMWNGNGKYTSSQGFSYEGEFLEGMKSGTGTYHFINGDVYKGEYVNDRENGMGTWISIEGWNYEGMFKDGQRNGTGKFVYANGTYYDGEWADNQKSGNGVETYYDEENHKIGIYTGEFQNDRRNGKGKFTYENGIIMEGDWINDEFAGEE